jgi:photosystem II stability/assembly factor-like uncharacterized protein
LVFAFFAAGASIFHWVSQVSNTDASLRGLHAVSPQVVWASGTHGTYLLTTDAGAHWKAATVAGAETLDFRDVEAFDSNAAFLLASGEGAASRLYKTADGGQHWTLLFTNPDEKGFFDALAFWDRAHGIILGDPVKGSFAIFTTGDGGVTWQRQQTAAALPDEGAFAASGTCLVVKGAREAWFATGGPGAGRVFRSVDGGKTWSVAPTPLSGESKSAGIFSLAFANSKHGIAVGGDYQKPRESARTAAVTDDGGKTWRAPRGGGLTGYRSGVVFMLRNTEIAVGTGGTDVSTDGGDSWRSVSESSFNAVASAGGTVWAVGPKGAIARLRISSKEKE